MAGAISAGAYTAGVMDYLIEALDEWEKRRGDEDVPKHKVVIKTIGGASAGGMTGIIAASAINNPITHVSKLEGDILKPFPENKLYNSWVDLTAEDMFPKLMETSDVSKGSVYSLFNSNFIDEIAERAVNVDKGNRIERPYFYNQMKLFATLSNVEGYSYNANFRGNLPVNDYFVSRHSDFACFELNRSENEYKDGWVPLDFFNDVNVDLAKNAAMATGAFPVGLRARKLSRNKKYVNDHKWFKDLVENTPVTDNPYESLIIDGGMINNEPFFKVREELTGIHEDHNEFKSTVLMIDPFPSEAESYDVEDDKLIDVIGGTLSAMVGHLRTKPEVLREALTKDDFRQFMIAPSRKVNGNRKDGSAAIACGTLGGFGGFVDKEFRIHDFFLGRANCEWFLRQYFTVPKDTTNPVFVDGYSGISPGKYVASDGRRQIIPLFTPKKEDMYMPKFEAGGDWPMRNRNDILRFRTPIKRRISSVVKNVVALDGFAGMMLGVANTLVKGNLAKGAENIILKSLEKHQLLKD